METEELKLELEFIKKRKNSPTPMTAVEILEHRERFSRLTSLKMAKTEEEKIFQFVKNSYREKNPSKFLKRAGNKMEWLSYLEVFLGDPQMGEWEFSNPERLNDQDHLENCKFLEQYTLCDERVLEYLKTIYHYRKREIWTRAAKILARLSHRQSVIKEYIESEWKEFYPVGFQKVLFDDPSRKSPKKESSKPPSSEGGMILDDKIIHRIRHIYFLRCNRLIIPPDGFSKKNLAFL